MLGSQHQPGILPCTVRDVFKSLQAADNEQHVHVQVSYLEIYNETVNDLFNKESQNLKLSSDEHGASVQGL